MNANPSFLVTSRWPAIFWVPSHHFTLQANLRRSIISFRHGNAVIGDALGQPLQCYPKTAYALIVLVERSSSPHAWTYLFHA